MLPSTLQRHSLFDARLDKLQEPQRSCCTQVLSHTFTCLAAVVVTSSKHLSGTYLISHLTLCVVDGCMCTLVCCRIADFLAFSCLCQFMTYPPHDQSSSRPVLLTTSPPHTFSAVVTRCLVSTNQVPQGRDKAEELEINGQRDEGTQDA